MGNFASTRKGVPAVSVTVGGSTFTGTATVCTLSDDTTVTTKPRPATDREQYNAIAENRRIVASIPDISGPSATRARINVSLTTSEKRANSAAWKDHRGDVPKVHPFFRKLLLKEFAKDGQDYDKRLSDQTIRKRFEARFHPNQIVVVNDVWSVHEAVEAEDAMEAEDVVDEAVEAEDVVDVLAAMVDEVTTGRGKNKIAEVAVDNDDDDDSQSQHKPHRLVNHFDAMEAEDVVDVPAAMVAEVTTGLGENNNAEVAAAATKAATVVATVANDDDDNDNDNDYDDDDSQSLHMMVGMDAEETTGLGENNNAEADRRSLRQLVKNIYSVAVEDDASRARDMAILCEQLEATLNIVNMAAPTTSTTTVDDIQMAVDDDDGGEVNATDSDKATTTEKEKEAADNNNNESSSSSHASSSRNTTSNGGGREEEEWIPPIEGDDPIQLDDAWETVEAKLEFSGWTKRRPPPLAGNSSSHNNNNHHHPFRWVKPGRPSENGGALGQDYFDNLSLLQAFCQRVYGWQQGGTAAALPPPPPPSLPQQDQQRRQSLRRKGGMITPENRKTRPQHPGKPLLLDDDDDDDPNDEAESPVNPTDLNAAIIDYSKNKRRKKLFDAASNQEHEDDVVATAIVEKAVPALMGHAEDTSDAERAPADALYATNAMRTYLRSVIRQNAGSDETGFYGFHTPHSVEKTIKAYAKKTNMNGSSRFIDFGTGMHGVPICAAVMTGCSAMGIEGARTTTCIAIANIRQWLTTHPQLEATVLRAALAYIHGDATKLGKWGSAWTHVYFWSSCFTPADYEIIMNRYIDSECIYMVMFWKAGHDANMRRHNAFARKCGWTLQEIGDTKTRMGGSREQHTAVFLQKTSISPMRHPVKTDLETMLERYRSQSVDQLHELLQGEYDRLSLSQPDKEARRRRNARRQNLSDKNTRRRHLSQPDKNARTRHAVKQDAPPTLPTLSIYGRSIKECASASASGSKGNSKKRSIEASSSSPSSVPSKKHGSTRATAVATKTPHPPIESTWTPEDSPPPASTVMNCHNSTSTVVTVDSFSSRESRTLPVIQGTDKERLIGCIEALNQTNEVDHFSYGNGESPFEQNLNHVLTFLNAAITTPQGEHGGSPGDPTALYICGVPGNGKTSGIKWCCNKMIQQVENGTIRVEGNWKPRLCEINATRLQNIRNPMKDVIESMGKAVGLSKLTMSNVERKLKQRGLLILVVDEIDTLVSVSKSGNVGKLPAGERVVQKLLEWTSKDNMGLAVIGISNSTGNEKFCRLQELGKFKETLTFNAYGVQDIVSILEGRIGRSVMDDAAMQFIGRKIANDSGDARKALKLAAKAVQICLDKLEKTGDKTTPGHLVKMVHAHLANRSSQERLNERIGGLPTFAKGVLCVLSALGHQDAISVTCGRLRGFCASCMSHENDIFTAEDFRVTIETLVELGLLRMDIVQKERAFGPWASLMALDSAPVRLGVQSEDVESAITQELGQTPFFMRMRELAQSKRHELLNNE